MDDTVNESLGISLLHFHPNPLRTLLRLGDRFLELHLELRE